MIVDLAAKVVACCRAELGDRRAGLWAPGGVRQKCRAQCVSLLAPVFSLNLLLASRNMLVVVVDVPPGLQVDRLVSQRGVARHSGRGDRQLRLA